MKITLYRKLAILMQMVEKGWSMRSINAVPSLQYSVDRQFIFRDVIALYRRQEIVNECPIAIMFVDEIAVDRGGVQ